MSAHAPHEEMEEADGDNEDMLHADEVGEEIEEDEDAHMTSDDDGAGDDGYQEILLQNDSKAHFDAHNDSIFCIAQHPLCPEIVATGGGDDVGYIWDSTPLPGPVLPASYETEPQGVERKSLDVIAKLEGHTDSINGITFTLPKGEYVCTAGLDGKVRVWHDKTSSGRGWTFLAEAAEDIGDINWISVCPSSTHPNTIALGASDGSVWVYSLDASESASPITPVQTYYIHTGPCTAGSWTSDGNLLATVSEDSSLYVWDPFGAAAEAGLNPSGAQYIIGLTGTDERFRVEGGLYSLAISPGGGLCAVGGAEGLIRVIGLPRFPSDFSTPSSTGSQKGNGASSKSGGGRHGAAKNAAATQGQTGQLLASLQVQEDSVESLSFSSPPSTLLASASVDGSIVLFDCARNFARRRKMVGAHEDEEGPQAVIHVDFVRDQGATHLLTSCGNDGVIKEWDSRGGTAAAGHGFVREWRGHRGGGDGGGVLAFVRRNGRIVTAGDDGVALVFEA